MTETEGEVSGPHTRPIRRAQAALLLMVVIWGVNFPVAKSALDQLTPSAFNALRFPLAALTLLIALLLRGGRMHWPERQDRKAVLALAILGNVVYQQFFIFGLANTRAGTAAVLLAGTPIITAILSAAIGAERLRARTWLGVLATFIGLAIVVLPGGGSDAGERTLLGDVLMIGASVAWAVYTVGSRRLVDRYGSIQFTAWTLWFGAAALLLIGFRDVLRTDLHAVSAGAWVGVVYSGALSVGLAYLIWYYGVRQIGNTRTAVYANLVPIAGLLAAWAQLGEVPEPAQIVGAAVIIAGVTVAQARARPPRV